LTGGGLLFEATTEGVIMNVVPFDFKSHQVRAVVMEDGDIWYVAADVASALEYRDASDMMRAVDDEDKGYAKVRTPGGEQHMLTINESGIYEATFKSRKKEARPFRRWLTTEVVPSIRGTGEYKPNIIKPSNESTIRLCHDIMLSVPGIDPGLVTSCTLRLIQNTTGLDTEPMRKLLPSLKEDPPSMNATAVGQPFGWNARLTNMILMEHGFQRRNDRGEWELTEEGRKHGGMIPFTNHGHSSYQILWKPSIVDALRSLEKSAA
jgi:prophage antirepressor-like protein